MSTCSCDTDIIASLLTYTVAKSADLSDSRSSRRQITMSRHEWETEGTANAANIISGLIRAWDTQDIARSWKVLVFVTAFCADCGTLHSFSMFEFDKKELYEAVGTSVTAFKIAQRIKELLLELLDTSATFDVSSLNLIQAPSD